MSQAVYRFAEFELNWETRVLSREGEPVALEPKVLEFIHYLLENRERAVGKEELAENLWPGRFISDSVITQTVRKARHAVDDDGERQAVIGTVRGFGYRFTAEIEDSGGDAASSSPSKVPARAIALGAAGVFLLAVLLILVDPRPASAPQIKLVAVLPEFQLQTDESPEWLAASLSDVVQSVLSESTGFAVIPRDAVSERLAMADKREQAFPDFFEQLGASGVIDGILSGSDTEWKLVIRHFGANGVQRDFSVSGEQPLKLALQAARGLASRFDSPPTEHALAQFEDDWLNQNYFRGVLALRQGDNKLAAGLFSTILEFAPDHLWTQLQLAASLNGQGDYEGAGAILERLVDNPAVASEHPALHRQAANALGGTWWYRGDLEKAADYFQVLAQEGRDAGHLLDAARGELNTGMAHSTRGDFELAEAHFVEAMALYSRARYQPGRAHVANALGIQAHRQNSPDQAEIWHNEALEVHRGLGNQRHISESLYNLGLIAAQRLQWQESHRLIEEAIMLARAVNDPNRELNYASNLGWNYARTGRISAGRALIVETLERAREIGYRRAESDCLKFLGALEMMAGNAQAALEWHEAAIAFYGPDDYGSDRIVAELNRAWSLLELERFDDARQALDHLAHSTTLDRQPGNRSQYLRLQSRLAQVEGNDTHALELLESAVESSMVAGDVNRIIEAVSALAGFHLEHDDPGAAAEVIDRLPPAAAPRPQVISLRARLAWQTGDPELAAALMEEARELYGERWNRAHQARLERYLAAL